MLNIPNSVKALYQTDGVRKNFRVHFPNGEFSDITNDNVVQESVKFTESLCSQSTFKFGLAEASVLEFETVGIGNMYGMTIEASIEIDCSSLSAADKATIAAGTWDGTWDAVIEIFGIPLGTFRVDKCPRNHGAMAHRQVTAYSMSAYSSDKLPYMPDICVASSMKVSVNALIAQASGAGLTEGTAANLGSFTNITGIRQSSTGYVWKIQLQKGTHGSGTSVMYRANLTNYDFGLIGSYNTAANYRIGQAAADAIDALGLGATFLNISNDAENSVYPNTGAALRDALPWLFSPCTGMLLQTATNNMDGYAAVSPNKYFPILGTQTNTSAFDISGSYDSSVNTSVYFYALSDISASDNLFLKIETQRVTGQIVATYYADLVLSNPEPISLASVRRFTLNNSTPYITLESTAALKRAWFWGGNNSISRRTFDMYSFVGACDAVKLLNGAIELYAAFIQRSRSGADDFIHLDNSTPVSIAPADYSEMWWDEYDVDPMGTVNITYLADDGSGNLQENTEVITIGSGQSYYDMADNEVLKALGVTLAEVTSLIETDFAPHVGAVAFTPTELTMQGWPWLEAGDALEITAEDGTIVETYALRVEMSGIQHLVSVITAEGGEIIEEVS